MTRRAQTAARSWPAWPCIATAKAWPARAEGSAAMNNVVLLGDSIFDNASLCRRRPRFGHPAQGRSAPRLDRGARRPRRLDHRRHRRPAQGHAVGRHPSGGVGRRQRCAAREGADRRKRAVGGRSARQARQDQGAPSPRATPPCSTACWRATLPTAVCTVYEAHYADPTTREIAAVGLSRVQRRDHARGVRTRPAVDRSQADRRRRSGLRQRHRAVGRRRCQDRHA